MNMNMLFVVICHMDQYLAAARSLWPIQQSIVVLIWVIVIDIFNMHSKQMKLNHFWLDRINFNWMIKKRKNKKKKILN